MRSPDDLIAWLKQHPKYINLLLIVFGFSLILLGLFLKVPTRDVGSSAGYFTALTGFAMVIIAIIGIWKGTVL